MAKQTCGGAGEKRAAIFGILLAGLTMAKPSLAKENTVLLEAMRQFAEPAAAVHLEDTIFKLLQKENRTGIQRLAEQIDEKDGRALEAIEKIAGAAEGTVSADDLDVTRLALSLGPCHYANLLVREVALLIAEDGTEAVIHNDVIEIDGAQVDDLYAQMITDCERLKGRPARKVKIGQPAR